jgi:hypothetical protein
LQLGVHDVVLIFTPISSHQTNDLITRPVLIAYGIRLDTCSLRPAFAFAEPSRLCENCIYANTPCTYH